jgi:T1SS-143 domain-containing protein
LFDDGTGSYQFTLFQPLDHPVENVANTLALSFGFTANDSDDDSASGTFTVSIVDDVPSIGDGEEAPETTRVDEASIGSASVSKGRLVGTIEDNSDGGINASVMTTGDGNRTAQIDTVTGQQVLQFINTGETEVRFEFRIGNANGEAVAAGTVDANTRVFLTGLPDLAPGTVLQPVFSVDGGNTWQNAGGTETLSGVNAPTIVFDFGGAAFTASQGDLGIDWGADNFDDPDTVDGQDTPDGIGDREVRFRDFDDTESPVRYLDKDGQPFALKSGGNEISYAVSEDGTQLFAFIDSAVGENGEFDAETDELIFTVTLSDDGTGSYLFELVGSIDHEKGVDDDDAEIDFAFTAVDSDGDTTDGTFRVEVVDDEPSIDENAVQDGVVEEEQAAVVGAGNEDTGPNPEDADFRSGFLGLRFNDRTTEKAEGTLGIDWGADDANPTSGGALGDRSVAFDPELDGPTALTSRGDAIRYELSSDGTVLTAIATDDSTGATRTVFTVSLSDNDNGSYEFTLIDTLDHPAEAEDENSLELEFAFVATDSDGDTVSNSFDVSVIDDRPFTIGTILPRYVEEEALSGGNPDGLDIGATATGLLNIYWGGDDTDTDDGSRSGFLVQDDPTVAGQRSVIFYDQGNGSVTTDTAENFISVTDGNGEIVDLASLSSNGQALTFRLANNGTILIAEADEQTVFTVELSDDANLGAPLIGAGSYTFNLVGTLDHPIVGDDPSHEDSLNFTFNFTARDGDGDIATGNFEVRVVDDSPIIDDAVDPIALTVDEDDIRTVGIDLPGQNSGSTGTSPNDNDDDGSFTGNPNFIDRGPANVSGSLASQVSFGADDGRVSFTIVEEAAARSALDALNLQSNGQSLSFDIDPTSDGSVVYGYIEQSGFSNSFTFGNGGDRLVFRLTLNEDGSFEFELFDQLDHVEGNQDNTDLQGGADAIDFGSIIQATDGDGDTVTLTDRFSIEIRDDVPEPDAFVVDTVRVDETYGLHSDNVFNPSTGNYNPNVVALFSDVASDGLGPDGSSGTIYARDNVVDGFLNVGADEFASDVDVELLVREGIDSGLDTTEGDSIFLFKEGELVVGRVGSQGGDAAFALHIDGFGRVSIAQYKSLKHPDDQTSDEHIDLDGKVFAQLTVTDNDGDTASDIVNIGANVTFDDDGPSAFDDTDMVLEGNSVAGIENVTTGNVITGVDADTDPNSIGSLTADEVGADDPGTVVSVRYNGADYAVSDGSPATINTAAGTLVMESDGSYAYTAKSNVLHILDVFNVRDEFESQRYDNNDGSKDWASNWSEDDGGSPFGGAIRINNDRGDGALRFTDGGRDGIERTVDLTGAQSATLSFDFREDVNRNNEDVRVFISSDGGPFRELIEIDNSDSNSYQNVSFDISGDISSNTTIRITVDDDFEGNDDIYIDNVNIEYTAVDGGVEVFEYTLQDADGDTDTAKLAIEIKDGGPSVGTPPALQIVDEDDLADGNNDDVVVGDEVVVDSDTLVTGDLAIAWGADDADTATGARQDAPSGIDDRSVTFDDALDGAMPTGLTSDGEQIIYEVVNGGTALIARADGRDVFAVGLNDDDSGSYTFRLLDNLDHSTIDTEDNIDLEFGFVATDSDGDTATGSFTVSVDDDSPDARWAGSHIEVDEATQIDTVVPGQLQFKPGADGAAVTSVSVHTKLGLVQRFDQENPAGSQIADLEVGGFKVTATTETVAGVTTITGTVEDDNDTPAFKIMVQPDGTYQYTQFVAFDHPDVGESGTADKVALRIDFTVTDGDGDTDTAGAYVRVADDTPIVDWTDSERTNNFRIISDDETVKDSNDDPIGNLGFGDNTSDGADSDSKEFHQSGKSLPISFGADGGTVIWNADTSKGLSGIEGGPDSITFDVVDNADTSVLLIKQNQGDPDNLVTVAEVTLDKTNGDYSYKQVANLLHAVDDTNPNVEDDATFNLGFTVEDGDGDIVKDSLPLIIDDDTPTIRPFDTNPDRTIIAEGTVENGISNDNGNEWNRIKTIDFSLGADGAAAGGAVAWDPVASEPADGSAVGFSFETDSDGTLLIYQDQGTAGNVLVAEVTMDSDTGRYEVIEKANVLHTGTNGDSASLTLKFTVTDGDGDTAVGERLLVLRDDAPMVSAADSVTVSEAGTQSVADQDDTFSAALDGVSYTFAIAQGSSDLFVSGPGITGQTLVTLDVLANLANGEVTARGNFGIDDPNPGITGTPVSANAKGEFIVNVGGLNTGGNYKVKFDNQADADAFANFAQTLEDKGLLNEAFRDNGQVSQTGNLNIAWGADGQDVATNNFNQDTPGGVGDRSVTFQFLDPSETAANVVYIDGGTPFALTSGGTELVYTLNADGTKLTAKAGDGGATIFVITLEDDDTGNYRFELVGPLDHVKGRDDADLEFDVKFTATDADGDTVNGSFEITVNDDVPDASDDTVSTEEDQAVVISVLGNDDTGADGIDLVNGVEVERQPSKGTVTYNDDGTFTYTPDDNVNGPDSFTYKVTDGDGDTSTATVNITINPVNDAPVIAGDDSGAVVEQGAVAGISAANAAGAAGDLEPTLALSSTVDDALTDLLIHPDGVAGAIATVQAQTGSDLATAITVVWDFLDDNYTLSPGGTVVVNEAFVRLGVEYASYLKDGGQPLVGVVAKFTADSATDPDSYPERLQTLHDNLLGNLNSSPLGSRFSEPLLTELTDLIVGIDGALLTRPVYSGNEGTDESAVRAFDVANGYDSPTVSGQLTASDVDAGAVLTWSDGVTAGAYGSFTVDATGKWTYQLDKTLSDPLAVGQSATEVFTVTVSDEQGATATQDVTITITGTNDAPVVVDSDPDSVGSADLIELDNALELGDSQYEFVGLQKLEVSDVDSSAFSEVTFEIESGVGSLAGRGNNINSYNNANGTDIQVTSNGSILTFSSQTGTLTLDDVNAILGSGNKALARFVMPDDVGASEKTIVKVRVTDAGDGNGNFEATSEPYTLTLNISGTNDTPFLQIGNTSNPLESDAGAGTGFNAPPVLTADAGRSFVLNSEFGPNLFFRNPDDDTGESLGTPNVVTVTVENGTLNLPGSPSGVTGAGTNSLEITGDANDITSLLRTLEYTPDTGFSGSDRLIIEMKDGGDQALPEAAATVTFPIQVAPATALFVGGESDDFPTLQAAVDAAAAGQTIIVRSGYTSVGDTTVGKELTILGEDNFGLSGTSALRSAESTIEGQITITSNDPVVIDGLQVLNPTGSAAGFRGITLQNADGHSILNTVFFSEVAGGDNGKADWAIYSFVDASGDLTITDNFFTGSQVGKYSDASWQRSIWLNGGGHDAEVSGNTFQYTRTGMNIEDNSDAITVTDNTFSEAGSGVSIGSTDQQLDNISNNTFNDVDTDFNIRNVTTPIEFDLGDGANSADDPLDYMVVLGGSADDSLGGGAGNDALFGNSGLDNAVFDGVLDASNFVPVADVDPGTNTVPGWQVDATAIGEGTDILVGMEIVQGADPDGAGGSTGRFLLVGNGGFATIQEAVDAAVDGDTILIGPGTYTLSSTLTVDKSLTIIGAGEGQTTLDASAGTSYGILVEADETTLQGFTLNGPADATGGAGDNYGIKVQPDSGDPADRLTDFTLEDVTVSGSLRSEIDLNGVDGATLKNVTADGMDTGGVGIALTDSANITLEDITTTGNDWGSIALFNANRFYDQQTEDITFVGTYSATEGVKIYAQDSSSTTDLGTVNFDAAGTGEWTLVNPDHRSNGDEFTFYFDNLTDAGVLAIALQNPPSTVNTSSVIQAPNGDFHVLPGMSIQAAIDAASDGDTIIIAPGTYAEDVSIDGKAITLLGDGGPDGVIIEAGAGKAGVTVSGIISGDVTIDGITVQNSDSGVSAFGNSLSLGNLVVQNSKLLNNAKHGVFVNGKNDGVGKVTVQDSTFENNGDGTSNGDGDIVLFEYRGDATLMNLVIDNSSGAGTADTAIQIAGFEQTDYDVNDPIGVVIIDNVQIDGTYAKVALYIQGYTDLTDLSLADVSGSVGAGWGYATYIDPMSSAEAGAAADTAGRPGAFNDAAADGSVDLSGVTLANTVAVAVGAGHPLEPFNGTILQSIVNGTTGGETINGTDGVDLINGRDGDDVIIGGLGNDLTSGGSGEDTFVLNDLSSVDTILDYTSGEDKIDLTELLDSVTLTDANKADYVKVEGGVLKVDRDGLGGAETFEDAANLFSDGTTALTAGTNVTIIDNADTTAIEISIAAA